MKAYKRLIIVLLVGLLFIGSAFSEEITNVQLGTSPNNYTVVIAKVGSEISVNNGGLVFYVSSASDTSFCFNIVSSSTPISLESMCVDQGKYVHIGKYLIYYLGNNSSNLGIFISNGVLPTVILNPGSGPFYANKNIQLEVIPKLGPKANISLTIVGNNGKTVIKYPYFTENNCQGNTCRMLINFKPTTTGQYNIKVTDCYEGFCVSNQTTITVTTPGSSQNNGKVTYNCKVYSLETGHTYNLYNGKLMIFINQIIKPQYSNSMIVNMYVNNQIFNLKVKQGQAKVGDFNITVLKLNDLVSETPKEIGAPYVVYMGNVTLEICKKEIPGTPSSLLNVYININNKNPQVGSTIEITAGINYIVPVLADLYLYTPKDNEILLGSCQSSHCKINAKYTVQIPGKYVIKLHYCLTMGCYQEEATFYAGTQPNPGGQNNVIKIYSPGVYTIPTNTTVIIYTSKKTYKLYFEDIEKRLGTSNYFVVVDYGSAMYNGYENKVLFNKPGLTIKIRKITTTKLLYSKCVTVEDCYSYYKGKVEIYAQFVGKSNTKKVLNIHMGINLLYPNISAKISLTYLKKYCKGIVELEQLTPNGWVSGSTIDLDNVLYILSLEPCSVFIPGTPKGKGIKNINLLMKTLTNGYSGYQTNNQIKIYLS